MASQGHYSNMSFAFSHSFSHECTRYEKFIKVVSDSTLQLIFKEIPVAKFGYSIKEDPQLSGKVIIKPFLLF